MVELLTAPAETVPLTAIKFKALQEPVIEAGWYFCIGDDDTDHNNWLRRRQGVSYSTETNEVYTPTEDEQRRWSFNLSL